MPISAAKVARLAHVNALVKIISSHGRRFFYNATHNRIARMEMDARGRLWWIDDYTDKRIYVANTGFRNRWRGFSPGGTLRNLVESLRDYVLVNEQLMRHDIGVPYTTQEGNHWGYDAAALAIVQAEAYRLPMFMQREMA